MASVTATDALLTPVRLGDIECRNRMLMAPMTRSRATADGLPTDLHVIYYGQRAGAGLIITEGIQPSIHGQGYPRTPGLHSEAQIAAWSRVTAAVHERGGRIVAQLMHVGRIASHYNKASSASTVAPSPIRAAVQLYTDQAGLQPCDEPEPLTSSGIAAVVKEYAHAAHCARAAGFDGVELHCTSGYLPMQFLASNTNRRDDAYGGTAARRARFVIETIEALIAAIGSGRVGVRIGIGNPFNDVIDLDPRATYAALLVGLRPLDCAYLHVLKSPIDGLDAARFAREHFSGPLILNDGFAPDTARAAIAAGQAEAISFARHFIANPDFVTRVASGAPLAKFNPKTLYTPGPGGYIDYPPLG
ncbi:MAG: alkene reductase [Acidobacteria bacterium]|nr:alkene reductase [Acidobacteriota bacterium]